MFQEFPYTNFHELNLDWIVKIAKDFLDQYTHIQEVIQTGLVDLAESRETGLEELDQKRLDSLAELNQKTLNGLADLQDKYDTLNGLLQAWYDTHSADIADQLADAIADFNAAAEAKSQALLDSWPDDYSELVTEYNNLKNAFELITEQELNIANLLSWEQGTFSRTNGATTASESTIRTTSAVPETVVKVKCSSSYSMAIWAWNKSDNSFVGHIQGNGEWGTGGTYAFFNEYIFDWSLGYKYYITFYNSDISSSIVPTAGSNCISYTVTDKTLTKEGKAADAKTVGDAIKNVIYAERNVLSDFSSVSNDSKNINQSGSYWIGSTTTQEQLAGLPKYGTALQLLVFNNAIVGQNISRAQVALYTNGDIYYRLVYGTSSNPTVTTWKPAKDYISVKSDGTGDYTSVVDAVTAANNGDTIIVYPGTYDGTIRAFQKTINIIGIDKNTCILQSTSGDYHNPAMEATTGHFENLTFRSKYISGTSLEIDANTNGAYAVHCDGSFDSGFGVGKTITFVNCRLESDFFPAFGCGASKNWKVEMQNCELISNEPLGRGKYTGSGSLGAMFFHDQAGDLTAKGHAEAFFKDCIFISTILKNTICINDLGGNENDVDMTFINNTVYSATEGFGNSIWWRGVGSAFGGIINLIPMSHGNTETELNA